MQFDINKITIDEIASPLLLDKKVQLKILRLDKIHPVISGNKLFKLHYFLEQARQQSYTSILSFGGAYSNHLVATAYACKKLKFNCTGIVRGEETANLSHTLKACINWGMQLEFVSRKRYAEISQGAIKQTNSFVIPEGGYHPLGAKGASLIMGLLPQRDITHICIATGTATTLAGLLLKAGATQTVVSIPVLKGFTDIKERLQFLTGTNHYPNLTIFDEYHFGGYAKKTGELINFMNELYKQYELPTDVVYTSKMMYAVFGKIKNGFFAEGSNIVCIHTGGLQGNASLPEDSLIF